MKRPYVIINCAMSADGKIASPSGKQIRLSSEGDIKRMYQLRNENDAVLVGINTVILDNPRLTVKEKYVKKPIQPIRIILDTHCRTPEDALVVNKDAKTLIIIGEKNTCNKKFNSNVELIKCETDKNGLINLEKMLKILLNYGIKKLMVEGGGRVIWSFLKNKLVDEMFVYIAPVVIGGKSTPTLTRGEGVEDKMIPLQIVDIQHIKPGVLIHYKI